MNSKAWLVVYAVGWVAWMLGFAVLDANGVTRQSDIWWALAGATLWPLCLPLGLFLFSFGERTRRISGGSAVRCIRWFAGVSYEKDDVKRRIANMSREWIPVTERLPEPYTLVLGGFVTMGEWVECLTAWHETHWYETEPSHWMPLPAPPTDAK